MRPVVPRSAILPVSVALAAGVVWAAYGAPRTARAQEPWQVLAGEPAILYRPGHQDAARRTAELVEPVRQQLQALFGSPPPVMARVRLHRSPTELQAEDPLADWAGEAIARTQRSRVEIDLVLDGGSAAEGPPLEGRLRVELAHRVLEERSSGRLPALWRAGVALWLQRPSEARRAGIARLREVSERQELPRWADLASPAAVYEDPVLGHAAALSAVHFLAHEHGVAAVLDLPAHAATAETWRAALERATGRSAFDLERRWRSWLPSYLDGLWRSHPLFAPREGVMEALLDEGRHAEAARLAGAVRLLAVDETLRRQADQVAQRAERASEVAARITAARQDLDAGRYRDAATAARAALDLLAKEDAPPAAVAEQLARDADTGRAAMAQLRRARELPPWRPLATRQAAREALRGFSALGHGVAAQEARQRLAVVERRMAWPGLALVSAGLVLAVRNGRRRRHEA